MFHGSSNHHGCEEAVDRRHQEGSSVDQGGASFDQTERCGEADHQEVLCEAVDHRPRCVRQTLAQEEIFCGEDDEKDDDGQDDDTEDDGQTLDQTERCRQDNDDEAVRCEEDDGQEDHRPAVSQEDDSAQVDQCETFSQASCHTQDRITLPLSSGRLLVLRIECGRHPDAGRFFFGAMSTHGVPQKSL